MAIVAVSIGCMIAPAAAFLPGASPLPWWRATLLRPHQIDPLQSAALDTSTEQLPLPLPPKDETWSPFAALREILAAPDVVEDAQRYDRVGGLSGGTWRSIVIGFIPCTVITFQQGSEWLLREEAAGNVYQTWPKTVVKVLGEKSFVNLSIQPELHAMGRKPLTQALSPKAVLQLTPTLSSTVDKVMMRLESFSDSVQEVALYDELRGFTLDIITCAFFGDYATPEFLDEIKQHLPTLSAGMISLPVRFPWPLNKSPAFGFGRSMDAREALSSAILKVLEARRADLASAQGGSSGERSGGILDSLIAVQRQQSSVDDEGQERFGDDFIVDNVITSLFAGTDTTSVMLTRVLQLLASADDRENIVEKLRRELNNVATSDDNKPRDVTEEGSDGAARAGILASFPFLNAVILEAFRLHPVVPAVFRKVRTDSSFNGYLMPAGTTINMNMIHGCRASSLYNEPKQFCPFRFLTGGKSRGKDNAAPDTNRGVSPEEPPPMFSVGRHTCPGRELSKLEILLFLRAFLNKFDYELVEGQSFKGVLPANGPKDKLRVILRKK